MPVDRIINNLLIVYHDCIRTELAMASASTCLDGEGGGRGVDGERERKRANRASTVWAVVLPVHTIRLRSNAIDKAHVRECVHCRFSCFLFSLMASFRQMEHVIFRTLIAGCCEM